MKDEEIVYSPIKYRETEGTKDSGELPSTKFLEWIMLQATEADLVDTTIDEDTGKRYTILSQQIQNRIREYMDNKFFLFDNAYVEETSQQEAIMKVFNICARKYGCKLFIVDNLMSALCSPDEENKAQAKFVATLKAFAGKYKCHVILVAHPRKERFDAQFTNDSVSGSSVITNLSDNVISVEKPNLRITKNREFGECPYIQCSYDPINRRIFQTSSGDKYSYSWDHTGIKPPEYPAKNYPEFEVQVGHDQSNARPF